MHFEQKKRCRISQLLLWHTDFKNMKIHQQKQCTEQGNKNNNFPFGQFYYRKFVRLFKHDIKFPTQIWKDFFSEKNSNSRIKTSFFTSTYLYVIQQTRGIHYLSHLHKKLSAKGHTVHRFKFQENWGGVWAWMNLWGRRGQEEASLTRYRPDLVFGKAMALDRCNYSYVYLTFGMKNFGIIWKNVAVSQSSSPQHLSVPTPWVRDNLWWSFRFWKAHARHVISFVIFNGWRYVIGIQPPRGLHAVSMKTGKHTWNKAQK